MTTIYTCPKCESQNVQALEQRWVNPNTGEIDADAEVPAANLCYYCNDCCDSVPFLDSEDPAPKHYVKIRWGLDTVDGIDIDPDDIIEEGYSFDTCHELDTFMLGVEQGCGWLGYKVLEDSRSQDSEVNNGKS